MTTAHIFIPKKYIDMFKAVVEQANGGDVVTMKAEIIKGDPFVRCEVQSNDVASFFDMGVDFALALTLKEKQKVMDVGLGKRLN